jgi:hypothetical protein
MKNFHTEVSSILKKLFDEAKSNGGLNYIYTLVRVDGMKCNTPDPILALQSLLKNHDDKLSEEEIVSCYCSLDFIEEPLTLIANLINCTLKKPYNITPFIHLYKGQFPDTIEPEPVLITLDLRKLAKDAGKPEIVQLINVAYPDDILKECFSGNNLPGFELLSSTFQKCRIFLSVLMETYFVERLKYIDHPKFHKLERFEVLEILVNESYGLYGFCIHFSNGNCASFIRNTDSTECRNIYFGPPLNFDVGALDQLKYEWRVGAKRLYEIGLQGRYNKLGEWKPIIYPGNSEHLSEDASSLSDDPEVQGILFYMMCTGHKVIEFVVRANIELPSKFLGYAEKFNLWKCPPIDGSSPAGQSDWIYDGWFELDSVDTEHIRLVIATIGTILNKLAFSYDTAVKWRIKYSTLVTQPGCAKPSEKDLHILESMLKNSPQANTNDSLILETALDWYNHALSTRNIFIAFLCYYIAIESVSVSVADGNADFGLGYSRPTKEERKREKVECIKRKHDDLYTNDPHKFVEEAYIECIYGLKKKTRLIAEQVFGPDHAHLKALFEKREGYSLSDIRSKLAHGAVTLLVKEDERLVRNRCGEIAEISKEFLTRIILSLKPTDPLPTWSGLHSASLSFNDPRTLLVATTDNFHPDTDWRIKSEWCD